MYTSSSATAPRSRTLLWSALVFASAFAVMLLVMNRQIGVYDEGLILTGGMLMASGKVIHRDFYANYGPAEFYLLSLLFKVFGPKVMVERFLDLIVRAGIVPLAYLAVRRYGRSSLALATAAICLLWLATVGNYGYPVYPALLLALAGTLLVVRILAGTPGSGRIVVTSLLAGLLVGAVTLFRYDIGFFTMIAQLATVAIVGLFDRAAIPQRRKAMTALFAYFAGVLAPLLGVAFDYIAQGSVTDFIHDVISFPAHFYAATRGLPFPSLRGPAMLEKFALLAIYLPLLVTAAVLMAVALQARSASTVAGRDDMVTRERRACVIGFAMLALLFFFKGVVRVSIEHAQLSLIPAVLALAIQAAAPMGGRWRLLRPALAGLLMLCAASALATAARVVPESHRALWDQAWWSGYASGAEGFVLERSPQDRRAGRTTHALVQVEPEREAALDYLVRHAGTQSTTFVGLNRHDRIYVNDVSAYFLSGQLPVTKWHHFDPGLQNDKIIQERLIADFERSKPATIWLESTWDKISEPNASATSSGVTLLDDYIAAHYAPAQTFGTIVILHRTGPDASPESVAIHP